MRPLPLVLALYSSAVAAGAQIGPAPGPVRPGPNNAPPPPRFTLVVAKGAYPNWRFLMPTDPEAARMLERGLDWLRRHQQQDGHWTDADAADNATAHGGHDLGLSALALLALAREGRPKPDSADHAAIGNAARWLADQQCPAVGATPSRRLGPMATPDWLYGHSIGTMALAAAVIATDCKPAKEALGPALDYLAWCRNPFGVWRYMPRNGDNDTSVSVWCTLACAAGNQAGEKTDPAGAKAMAVWLDSVTGADGRTGYQKRGEGSSRTMQALAKFPADRCETLTAAALLCREALGQSEDQVPTWRPAREVLLRCAPKWDPEHGCVDYLGWFFGTEAMQRQDARSRKAWRDALVAAASAGQHADGDQRGSWDPVDPWSDIGGRTYATAMMVLALQALYDSP
jgi:hypothetical protein